MGKIQRDSVERIREKRKQIEAFIREFDSYEADCEGSYFEPSEALCTASDYNNEQFRSYLQLKLQLLTFYGMARELGVSKKVLNRILDSAEVCLCGCAEDSCLECFSVGFEPAPFWSVGVTPGALIYQEDYENFTGQNYDEEDAEVVRGFICEDVLDLCKDFIRTFPVTVDEDEMECLLRYNDGFISLVMEEELFYDSTASYLFGVHSQILPYYTAFMDSLGKSGRKAVCSHPLVKEIEHILEGDSYFSPGKSFSGVRVLPDLFLYRVYDVCDGYNTICNFSQLYADFNVGLKANLLDLLIFELDEEFHFLPEMYVGRSNEILPDFKGKSEVLEKWMAKKAV